MSNEKKPSDDQDLDTPSAKPEEIFEHLDEIRIPQSYAKMLGGRRDQLTIPVGKPSPQTWFMVHPGADYQLTVPLLVLKEENAFYFVQPQLFSDLASELRVHRLRLVITPQANLRIWPIPDPTPDGRDYWESTREAAFVAESRWIRLTYNFETRGYDLRTAEEHGEPRWPALSLGEILKTAFRGRVIDSMDHPIVERLLRPMR